MTETASHPPVSVVTPFHNTAGHLRECIESVLSQSDGDFEYVLQDNASDDGSTEIALEYAQRDSRVRYFRVDELVSQVDNYNLALTRISPVSRYTKIVQADDWISRDCLREMVLLARTSARIGLVSAYRLRGDTVGGDGVPYTMSVLPGRDVARLHLLTSSFLFGSPTTVMYCSDVVRSRQPFYTPGRLNDDTEACYEILRDWDFGFVHQVLSFTRLDDDSTYGRNRNNDPGILDRLITLRRYGAEFLSDSEYPARLNEVERRYYRRLAWAVLCGRERTYWDFHRRGLATQGPGIEPRKLVGGIAREALSLVGCPARMLEIVGEWLSVTRR